jgi:glycerol-3-phosphate dehydrogenase
LIRDLRRLADTRFDVVVIGAGIYGAIAAWDATDRGLSVALIDQDDFGSGTSFNNLKTLHGGLRSLTALNLPQMRLFIRERRALARVVPHLVRPLGFVVATSWHPLRSTAAWRVLLALNDQLARGRNDGLPDPGTHLPAGHIVSRADALRMNPVISPDGVTGAAVWYDYQMINADRVTFSFLLSAVRGGAAAANYVRATRLLYDHGRITGVRVEDRLGGGAFDIRAAVVVNAAGGWAKSLLAGLPGAAAAAPAPHLSRAMNLVVKPLVRTHACGGMVDGRYLFMVPWRDVTLIGTSHDALDGGPDDLHVTRWDIEAFIKDTRAAFPHAGLTAADVRLVHRGVLPMLAGTGSRVRLLRESVVVDHGRSGVAGLISIFGVRYTTARHTAERAVDAAFRALGGKTPPPCRTAETPLVGGTMTNVETFLKAVLLRDVDGVPAEAMRRLVASHGTGYDAVLQIARDIPNLAQPLGARCPVTGAEILHAARKEMAIKLADAVVRRTEAGSAGHPGEDALDRAASIMARAHGWDEARRRSEIAEVQAFYQLPRE